MPSSKDGGGELTKAPLGWIRQKFLPGEEVDLLPPKSRIELQKDQYEESRSSEVGNVKAIEASRSSTKVVTEQIMMQENTVRFIPYRRNLLKERDRANVPEEGNATGNNATGSFAFGTVVSLGHFYSTHPVFAASADENTDQLSTELYAQYGQIDLSRIPPES